jgi:hypothetical protein
VNIYEQCSWTINLFWIRIRGSINSNNSFWSKLFFYIYLAIKNFFSSNRYEWVTTLTILSNFNWCMFQIKDWSQNLVLKVTVKWKQLGSRVEGYHFRSLPHSVFH